MAWRPLGWKDVGCLGPALTSSGTFFVQRPKRRDWGKAPNHGALVTPWQARTSGDQRRPAATFPLQPTPAHSTLAPVKLSPYGSTATLSQNATLQQYRGTLWRLLSPCGQVNQKQYGQGTPSAEGLQVRQGIHSTRNSHGQGTVLYYTVLNEIVGQVSQRNQHGDVCGS
ncbi:hypothetical protein S40288_11702 [Stachybotrys chartarum IBT 40288]|nr:hypothetical protein S40288_11702 [Stachybotrys chartarum IBT 40288]